MPIKRTRSVDIPMGEKYPDDMIIPSWSVIREIPVGNVLIIVREGSPKDFPKAPGEAFTVEGNLRSRRISLRLRLVNDWIPYGTRWCPGEVQYLFRLKKLKRGKTKTIS